ncbi:MAG: hypothetical protein IJO61_05970 [Oscillospiraceae bacterium]|nr:hypothetical protein [Oscillospiraceae bacterium]
MKKKTLLWITPFFLCIFFLTSCKSNSGKKEDISKNEYWGSFTAEKTYSFDNAFYALQTTVKREDASYIVVDIYRSENDEKIYSFSPARASDFWGICWENETYNIWIQSSDIGIYCYEYRKNSWILNKSAVRPKEIISKYD